MTRETAGDAGGGGGIGGGVDTGATEEIFVNNISPIHLGAVMAKLTGGIIVLAFHQNRSSPYCFLWYSCTPSTSFKNSSNSFRAITWNFVVPESNMCVNP